MALIQRRRWHDPLSSQDQYLQFARSIALYSGIEVSRAEAARLLRLSGGQVRNAVQRLREEARNPRTRSRFERNIAGPESTVTHSSYYDQSTSDTLERQETRMMNNLNGTLNTVYTNDKLNGKRRRNDRRYIVNQFVKNSLQESIFRWQSLTPFEADTLRSYSLENKVYSFGENRFLRLPCFAFNLSAMPWRVSGDPAAVTRSYPMYRLFKQLYPDAVTTAGTKNYKWEYMSKVHGGNEGQDEAGIDRFAMVAEKNESNNFCDKYLHNWSDIKLLIQGRKKYETKVHIYVVSFLNYSGPLRTYAKGETEFVEDSESAQAEERASADHFWDRFWQKKVVHPLASTLKPDVNARHMVVHYHKSITFPVETTIENDYKTRQHIFQLFYKNNDSYNVACNIDAEETGWKMVHDNDPVLAGQLENPPGYPVKPNTVSEDPQYSPYVSNRHADKWLMICAEEFNRDVPTSQDNYCSFDCVIRSKFTYYSKP